MSCVLAWTQRDTGRVCHAIEQAIRDCVARWPGYAESRVEVDGNDVHVHFPSDLVERPHWEMEPPQSPLGPDGSYPCTFRHYLIEPDLANELDGECGVSLDSNTSANRDAWMTASHVFERMTQLLDGTLRDF
jgi:hypothetical protein